jgi:hypothetical protein
MEESSRPVVVTGEQIFSVHHIFAIVVYNGNGSHVYLLCSSLLFGTKEKISDIYRISTQCLDTAILVGLTYGSAFETYLGVCSCSLNLRVKLAIAAVPTSLHGEQDAGVGTVEVIVMKIL